MSQYEQENDLGRGGGEVDDETTEAAAMAAAERRGTANVQDDAAADSPEDAEAAS